MVTEPLEMASEVKRRRPGVGLVPAGSPSVSTQPATWHEWATTGTPVRTRHGWPVCRKPEEHPGESPVMQQGTQNTE